MGASVALALALSAGSSLELGVWIEGVETPLADVPTIEPEAVPTAEVAGESVAVELEAVTPLASPSEPLVL